MSELYRQLLTKEEADKILDQLHEELDYVPRDLMVFRIFNSVLNLPRDKQFYGDVDENGNVPMYRYGSDWYPPVKEWTPTLRQIRDRIKETTGQYCNHVVVNRYTSGDDHIGYHHDKTPDFVEGTSVCTVSLGDSRVFQLKHIGTGEVTSYQTPHGSLQILDWNTNKHYKHRIAKTSKPVGERISLTYRSIKSVRTKQENEEAYKRIIKYYNQK